MSLATKDGARVLLQVYEPGLLKHPTTSSRHVTFQWECGKDIDFTLEQEGWGMRLERVRADVLEAIEWVRERHGLASLHSHEETGVLWTFERDKKVARWCQTHGIPWHEVPQPGVQRRRKSRAGWVEAWHVNMARPWANPDLEAWRASDGTGLDVTWPAGWKLDSAPYDTNPDDIDSAGPLSLGRRAARRT